MGGGRQCLVSNSNGTDADPIDTWSCYSTDGRNLIRDWKLDKQNRHLTHSVLTNNDELKKFNPVESDYVLGIFANGHLRYNHERDNGTNGTPSLSQMTSKAIKLLSRNKNKGFLLVIESGLIDMAHHRGWAKIALSEVAELDETVKETIKLMHNYLDETLIMMTADHTHTLTINGYPKKGNSIFGLAQNSKFDGIPYTTLTYATGHFGYKQELNKDGIIQRHDPSKDDTEAFDYVQPVAIKTDENTHGGSDVTIHAMGPSAHLFHKIHEQSYVAHVIQYAARIGRFRDSSFMKEMTDFLRL